MSERFQHTAARRRLPRIARRLARCPRCFNTQPPEGGCPEDVALPNIVRVSTHSRPKAAADNNCVWQFFSIRFQHTAARRRLPAAASAASALAKGFNTQPPEGGCETLILWLLNYPQFQHTAARRRLHLP